jgi:hypothetical protein
MLVLFEQGTGPLAVVIGGDAVRKRLSLLHFESDRHEIWQDGVLNDTSHRLTVPDFLFSIWGQRTSNPCLYCTRRIIICISSILTDTLHNWFKQYLKLSRGCLYDSMKCDVF